MIRFLFDEYMFRILPREFPAAVMGALVPLLFLSVHQWGLMWGALVDVALVYGSSKLRQDSIVKALSRIQIGCAVGIILTLLWSYFTFITEFMSITYDMIVLVVSPFIFITLYLASYTPAERLPPRAKRGQLYQKIVRAGYKEGMTELENAAAATDDDLYKSIWALKRINSMASSSIEVSDSKNGLVALNLDDASMSVDEDEVGRNEDADDDSQGLLRPATKLPSRLCVACLCDKSEGSTHCYVSL